MTTDLILTDRAALALLDEAERALAAVDNPEDADELWRKVKAVGEAARLARLSEATLVTFRRVQLRAKRRYGELLGPAEHGGDRRSPAVSTVTPTVDRDYNTEKRARKLAAVPEPAFRKHLEQSDPDKLSEAAIVRQHHFGSLHHSSETDEWATPQDLFDRLDREFHFDVDVCATPDKAKCERYFSPQDDGLAQNWPGVCWMNPPYGQAVRNWMLKARDSGAAGATVVCLVKAAVETNWWWDTALAGEIRFLRGRLTFGEATAPASFGSAVVIFGPSHPHRVRWWDYRTEELRDAA